MKKFRRSRDNGSFALTTLQNPNLEVRSLSQLIAAAEQVLAEDAACLPAGAAHPRRPVIERNAASGRPAQSTKCGRRPCAR